MGLELYSDVSIVKRKYRELALLYHPDKNPGDSAAEEFFKILTQGYNILSEPEKKFTYDSILRRFLEKSPAETVEAWESKGRESMAERLRKHRERQRQSIIDTFEEDERSLSHPLRLVIAILIYISGLLIAYNNWFLNLLDLKIIYIIMGSFLVGLGAYLIANNRYQVHLFNLAKGNLDYTSLKGPVRLFSVLFLVTPILFLLLTQLTKTVHLNYFYDVTIVDRIDEHREGVTYQYTVNGEEIARSINELPIVDTFYGEPEKKKQMLRVKFSRINPNISELITTEQAMLLKMAR